MAKAAKAKTAFCCSDCGAASAKWLGRCPGCAGWNTLVEERVTRTPERTGTRSPVVSLGDVRGEDARRIPTGIEEFDRALGGGPVAGGVVLLGGDPGIGKSTLLMQVLSGLAGQGLGCLYVTGEESAAQVAMRARRIGGDVNIDSVQLLATTDLNDAVEAMRSVKPTVVVIDSIQTLRSPDLESASGSVGQIREVAGVLVEVAKRDGIALFLIGHVTKDGMLAGPKVLEHLVDTVLSFEGDRTHAFRMVRAVKNRFGPAHELGVFEMVREGLREVPDPSKMFLAERPAHSAGSLVVPTAEGSRPLLVEVQALVAPAVYGSSRRVATGVDQNRLAILLAVLDRKAQVQVLDHDVFASIAGGARVVERALDLALAVAIVSSLRERPVNEGLVAFGEVGLAGEVRAVPRPGQRLGEARKLGFSKVILPAGNAERLTAEERAGLELSPVRTLTEALAAAF